ncbi:MAG: hypothetical protein D9V47_13990 [Clostridia bacterium]|nr:MAG: hypothetical protein D9V47_13990 [Clostridia bacterium]
MDLFVVALTSFGVALSGALMPGPLLVSNIAETSRAGLKGGVQVVSGHALLEAVTVALLLAGVGQWLSQGTVLGTVALAGGVGLAFLGWSTLHSPGEGAGADKDGGGAIPAGLENYKTGWPPGTEPSPASPAVMAVDSRGDRGGQAAATGTVAWTAGKPAAGALNMSPLLSGITASAANPYWLLWWATVGTGYLALASPLGWYGFIVFYLAHVSADFLWYGAISWGLVTGQSWFQGQITGWVLRVAGSFLLALAAYFIYTGLGMLL